MLGYLSALFGQILGNTWLERITALGFTGVRTDIHLRTWEAVVDELGKFAQLAPIFLFGGGHMEGWTPEMFFDLTASVARKIKKDKYFVDVPVYFEIGNEPDIATATWRQNPQYLADTFWECYRYVKAINGKVEFITGGISNLHENGLDWLEEYIKYSIQDKAIIGFHRYPNGSSPEVPHSNFPSREHEMNRLKALSGGRKLFCTETGLSTGPHKKARNFPLCVFKKKFFLPEEAQSEAFKLEWNFYKRRGVLGMVWYQHRDGANRNNFLNNYGIFNVEEEEKVICDTIRETLL